MRRVIVVCAVLALCAAGCYVVVRSFNDNASSSKPDKKIAAEVSAAATATAAAGQNDAAAAARQPHATNIPALVDGKLPPGVYRPPTFGALPEGLNGRQLRDIHDALAKAAESGDATAAYKLGSLVDECAKGMRQIEEIRQKNITTLSSNPVVNIWLKDQYAVMVVQCPQLNEAELGSAAHWMLLAAKGGDRESLLGLAAFPPATREPDYEAKKSEWQRALITGLDVLAQARDSEAAIRLAHYFHVQRGIGNLKSAYKYFDLASKGDGSPAKIEYSIKMRDQLASEIARGERDGG